MKKTIVESKGCGFMYISDLFNQECLINAKKIICIETNSEATFKENNLDEACVIIKFIGCNYSAIVKKDEKSKVIDTFLDCLKESK